MALHKDIEHYELKHFKNEHEHEHHDHEHHEHEHEHEHHARHHHCHCHDDECECADEDEEEEHSLKKIIISFLLFIAAMLLQKLPVFALEGSVANVSKAISLALYASAYLLCGFGVLHEMAGNFIRKDFFSEETLMGISTIGALILGEYSEAVAVMILFRLGEYLEDLAVGSSKRSIKKLVDIRADKAVVLRDGKEVLVSSEDVSVGEVILVRAGERVPLDGEIVKGSTFADTSALTGEAVPRELLEGHSILAGFINTRSAVEVKVSKPYAESSSSRIIRMVEDAQKNKSRTQKFVTRISKVYTPFVCALALLVAIVPPLFTIAATGFNSSVFWKTWIYRALELLVVSCPCALVISVPLTFFAGIGKAGKSGVLIKGADYLELLSKAKTVVFDKTGTLTKGVFEVTSINPAAEMDADELLALATHAEYYSNHPISRSLKTAHNCPLCKKLIVEESTEISGRGLKCTIQGNKILVGNMSLMQKEQVKNLLPCSQEGTVIHVAKNGEYCGFIVISDIVKEDSKNAISLLKDAGVKKTVMLTGDTMESAKSISEDIGLDEYYASLLPEDKVSKVKELLNKKEVLVFVGDGINDAPVLTCADVGIAMGAMGSDAAIEAADVVLMDDLPCKTFYAIKLSKKTMGIVWQNVWGSLLLKSLIILLAVAGIANMWLAVFGDVGVTMIAVLNSMRLMTKTKS